MTDRTKKYTLLTCILLLVAALVWWQTRTGSPRHAPEITLPTPPPPSEEDPRLSSDLLVGEKLLYHYGSGSTTVNDDLQAIRNLLVSYVNIVKNHSRTPIGGNLDLADALRGKNAYKERFLPDAHHVFNSEGEMIDRWKTPLHIHPIGAGQWEVRSAGPDQKLWTKDDLTIDPKGKFHQGR